MNKRNYASPLLKDILENIDQAPAGEEILDVCLSVAHMLIHKNISYGNSALSPIGIFAKGNSMEQLSTRIDDKLNRIKNSQSYPGDNDIDDLIGYLILYKIAIDKSTIREV